MAGAVLGLAGCLASEREPAQDRMESAIGEPAAGEAAAIVAYAERGLLAFFEAQRAAAKEAFRQAIEAHADAESGSEEAVESSRALVDAAARHLRAVGVAFSRHDEPLRLVIEPDVRTPLGALARDLRDELDTSLAYVPEALFAPPGARSEEMSVEIVARFDEDTVSVIPPHEAIATLDADDLALRHEIIHADSYARLRRGERSPYHGSLRGSVSIEVCELSLGWGVTGLDELRAYGHVIDLAASELASLVAGDAAAHELVASRSFDAPRCNPGRGKAVDEVTDADTLWGTVARSVTSGLLHAEILGRYVDDYEHAVTRATRFATGDHGAWIWLYPEGERWPRLQLRLADSTGSADPRNGELLATQYAWIRATIHAHLRQLRAIDEAFEEMQASPPRERVAIACALPVLTRQLDPERETHPDLAGPRLAPVAERLEAYRARRISCGLEEGEPEPGRFSTEREA